MRRVPELRKYEGPHDSVELMVADGRYHTVRNANLKSDAVKVLGLEDADVNVTVSDDLAALLPEDTWPKVGGKPAKETIDDPASNPATKPPPEDAEPRPDLPVGDELGLISTSDAAADGDDA